MRGVIPPLQYTSSRSKSSWRGTYLSTETNFRLLTDVRHAYRCHGTSPLCSYRSFVVTGRAMRVTRMKGSWESA
jgi:hypothetical protein